MRRDPHVVIVALLCALMAAALANAQSGSSTLLGTLAEPAVTGRGNGRPKVEEVVAYWPALIPKCEVTPEVAW